MFYIFLAVILIVLSSLFKILKPEKFDNVFVVCISIAVTLFVVAIISPVEKYEEPVIAEEYELLVIVENTDAYIIQTDKGTKICKYEMKSEYDETVKKVVINEVASNVKIEYAEEFSKPVLRKYVKKVKKSIWNGIGLEDIEYFVLFTPESYVVK